MELRVMNGLPKNKEGITMEEISLEQKFTLTIKEASVYFNVGQKKLRRLAEPLDDAGTLPYYVVWSGNQFLIIRHLFEKYLMEVGTI